MPSGIVIVPANTIVIEGNPVKNEMKVGANATLAKMLPGIFVTYDAADNSVKEAADEDDLVVGQLDMLPNKGQDEYPDAVGDQVIVLTGSYKGMARLINAGTATTLGVGLTVGTDGYVKVLAVGAMGSQGPGVGKALMAANPAGGAVKIVADIDVDVETAAAS